MHPHTIITNDEQFHAARLKGVGASDVPVLAGLHTGYKRKIKGQTLRVTPALLWAEKTGRIPPFEGNNFTYWGKKHEPTVREEFLANLEQRQGHGCRYLLKTEFVHPDYSYAISHPDLIYFDNHDTPVICEIKTGGYFQGQRRDNPDYGYNSYDNSANGLPGDVYLQVQWQMFTSGIRTAWVAVLINGNDYREYGPIDYQPGIIETLLERVKNFWHLVETDQKPTITTATDAMLIWPEVKKQAKVTDREDLVQAWREWKAREKTAKKAIEELRVQLVKELEDNDLLTDAAGDKLVSQTVITRESVSLAGVKKDAPGLYGQLKPWINPVEYRRLTVAKG